LIIKPETPGPALMFLNYDEADSFFLCDRGDSALLMHMSAM
jgi:hypothetical protein